MTPRRVTTFRIEEEVLDAMQVLFERDGVRPAEQAIRAWLATKGVKVKSARPARVKRADKA